MRGQIFLPKGDGDPKELFIPQIALRVRVEQNNGGPLTLSVFRTSGMHYGRNAVLPMEMWVAENYESGRTVEVPQDIVTYVLELFERRERFRGNVFGLIEQIGRERRNPRNSTPDEEYFRQFTDFIKSAPGEDAEFEEQMALKIRQILNGH